MAVVTAFLIALSFCHFVSLQSTLIFSFNPDLPFEVPHFHLTQPLDSIDVTEQRALCLGAGGSAAGADVSRLHTWQAENEVMSKHSQSVMTYLEAY